MEGSLVLFSLFEPLPFNSKAMKKLWSRDSLQVLKDPCEMQDIMTINRTEISEVQTFKKVAPVEYCTFGSGFKLGSQSSRIWSKSSKYSKYLPNPVLKPVISFTGCNIKEILLQGTNIGIDSYLVIVKDHEYI